MDIEEVSETMISLDLNAVECQYVITGFNPLGTSEARSPPPQKFGLVRCQ